MSTRTMSVRRWLAIGTLFVGALALAGCHGAHRAAHHYGKGHYVAKPHHGGKHGWHNGGHHRRGHHRGRGRRHW